MNICVIVRWLCYHGFHFLRIESTILLVVCCVSTSRLAGRSEQETCLAIIIAVASHGPTPWFVSVDTRVYAPFIHMTGRPRLNGGDERVRVRKKREAMWLPP